MNGDQNRRTILRGLGASILSLALLARSSSGMTAMDLSQLPPDKRAEVEAMLARVLAALPYERLTIDGASALTALDRLRAKGRGLPVIIGDADALERIAEQYSLDDPKLFPPPEGPFPPGVPPQALVHQLPRSPAKILEAASHIRFPEDLSKWEGAATPDDLQAPAGNWPASPSPVPRQPMLMSTTNLLTGEVAESVNILLIPAAHSWDIPAWLRWGGWNACPPPEYHVAALHRWHDLFGAELVGIGPDSMDLHVERPPGDRATALKVAREIYGYCPDSVDQGTETIIALAETMVMHNWWSFWWD